MAEDRSRHAGRSSNEASPAERREVHFSGRVQGVGFRQTARAIAGRMPVTGCVRNLPDGRVQLVAEGPTDVLDELLRRIEGEMGRFIRGRDVAVRPATGEFSAFEIVY